VQNSLDFRWIGAEEHIAAPAPEAGLQNGREVEIPQPGVMLDQPRARMRQSGAPKAPRGHELVVSAQERRRWVQHGHARLAQQIERPEALIDTVEVAAKSSRPSAMRVG
jgi:hypothetical protein